MSLFSVGLNDFSERQAVAFRTEIGFAMAITLKKQVIET